MTNQPQPPNADPQTSRRNTVFTARVIHAALLIGMLIFAAVAFFIAPGMQEGADTTPDATHSAADPATDDDGPELQTIFGIVVGVLLVGGIAFAALTPPFFAKQARTSLQNTPTPPEADAIILQTWMSSVVVRSAVLEGAGLFAAVVIMLTAQPVFLVPVVVAAGALVVIAPSRAKLDAFESLAKNGSPHPTAM